MEWRGDRGDYIGSKEKNLWREACAVRRCVVVRMIERE